MRKINLCLGNVFKSEILVCIISLNFCRKKKKKKKNNPPPQNSTNCIEVLILESNKLYNLYTEKKTTNPNSNSNPN